MLSDIQRDDFFRKARTVHQCLRSLIESETRLKRLQDSQAKLEIEISDLKSEDKKRTKQKADEEAAVR